MPHTFGLLASSEPFVTHIDQYSNYLHVYPLAMIAGAGKLGENKIELAVNIIAGQRERPSHRQRTKLDRLDAAPSLSLFHDQV